MQRILRNCILICLLLTAASMPALTQGIKLSYVPKTASKYVKNNTIPYLNYKVLQTPALPPANITPLKNGIHYTAFFCRMESKVHDKLNLWIKLRAGTDEEYRKFYGSDNH